MNNILARSQSFVGAVARSRAFLYAVAVAGCLMVGNVARAQGEGGGEAVTFPSGVPQIVSPTAVVNAATGTLGALALPFILTSLGILALYMIWRFGKRIVAGHA